MSLQLIKTGKLKWEYQTQFEIGMIKEKKMSMKEKENDSMTQNINEYVDRFKSKYGIQSVVLPIKFKGTRQ